MGLGYDGKLYILAFDHRGSFQKKMFGIQGDPTAEETEKILRWLESDGVRLVHVDGEWSCPVGGASRHLRIHDRVAQSREDLVPFEDRRHISTVHQPVR